MFLPALRRPACTLALIMTLCSLLTPSAARTQNSPPRSGSLPLPLEEVRIFTEALDRIRTAYVEEINDKTLLENAIKGMLLGLDPHSAYMAGSDYEVLQETTTGEFGGLGVEVGRENGAIRVISPIDDTPADRAGIQAGDLIIRINNQPLQTLSPEEVAGMLRGEPGTDVTVTIAREGLEPFDLTIVREVITINSVRSSLLEPGYAYLRIAQFRQGTGEEVETEITRLHQQHGELKGLVLDLRNNPGGVLQASVRVVDNFIDEGLIVYTEGRLEGNDLRFFATPETTAPNTPLVVLINNGSASASEIVAGALQDHGRAIIMGNRSFGKGSVQSVLPLDETRAIKLTTSLYFTPNGLSIQAQGITPDVIADDAFVTRRRRNMRQYNEADLPGALNNANGQESEQPRADGNLAGADTEITAEEVLVADYPLNQALNLLKGINALKASQRSDADTVAWNIGN